MRQPLLSFRKKSRKQKVFVFNSCFHFRLHTVHVQWTLHDLCFFGILRCCSFLSIERNKELNKLLSQAKRKAVKMEQQLQKSKVLPVHVVAWLLLSQHREENDRHYIFRKASLVCCKAQTSAEFYDRYWIPVSHWFFSFKTGGDSKCQAWGRVWSVHVNIFCTCGHIAFFNWFYGLIKLLNQFASHFSLTVIYIPFFRL